MKKFNIFLAGHSNSKKHEFVEAKINQKFDKDRIRTLGQDEVFEDYQNCRFKIFDLNEQERHNSLDAKTIGFADGFLVVFSVYDKDTFNNLVSKWLESFEMNKDLSKAPVVLVGIKDDDQKEKAIKKEDVEKLEIATKFKMPYFETTINRADSEHVLKTLYDTILVNKQN